MHAERSVRLGFLLRRSGHLVGDGEGSELVGELPRVESSAGCGPEPGGELEVPVLGPGGQDADELAEVQVGIELVELRRVDEAHDVVAGLGVAVAAAEEPVLTPDRDASQPALRTVVGHLEAAVAQERGERSAMSNDVAERIADEAADGVEGLQFRGGPLEEPLDVDPEVYLPQPLDVVGWSVPPRGVELEDAAKDTSERAEVRWSCALGATDTDTPEMWPRLTREASPWLP